MRYLFLSFILLISSYRIAAQHTTRTTDSITVTGAVRQPVIITTERLAAMPSVTIPDLQLISHSGAMRSKLTQLQGILLAQLLAEVAIDVPHPKLLSEYFVALIATDGYKVVFSWNELFNNPLGKSVFVVTAEGGKKLQQMTDRLLVITTSDIHTGRRHIKSVEKIVIKRFE